MSRKTRKADVVSALVAVLAVAGALAIFAVMAPGSLFATALTDAPLNLKAKAADGNAGRTDLVLTWDSSGRGRDAHRLPD